MNSVKLSRAMWSEVEVTKLILIWRIICRHLYQIGRNLWISTVFRGFAAQFASSFRNTMLNYQRENLVWVADRTTAQSMCNRTYDDHEEPHPGLTKLNETQNEMQKRYRRDLQFISAETKMLTHRIRFDEQFYMRFLFGRLWCRWSCYLSFVCFSIFDLVCPAYGII